MKSEVFEISHSILSKKKIVKMKSTITMLGTGNAAVTKCYNTCFVITTPQTRLLVDAGGGNGVLSQLEKANIPLKEIHHLFITHAHTDHILGCIWVVRMVAQAVTKGKYEGQLHVYGHDKSLQVLTDICRMTLPKKIIRQFGDVIVFREVKDGDSWQVEDMRLTCFDIQSAKEKQFGFQALLPDGQLIVCLGDEPYKDVNESYVRNADWMLCEAFCLYKDREQFKPYEKHHCTTMDVGKVAHKLQPKHVVVYHTEDTDLTQRKERYSAEVREAYSGDVQVPDDLEVIEL